MRRFLPILDWLPRYDRRWLRGDVAAGIAVTALIVPKNLGYAGIAGVPLENGLYAAAAGALIYALFCTSRQISTGPSSSLAAVAGGAVLVTGLGGDQAAQLVAAITLLTGVLFLLACPVEAGLDRSVPLQGGRDRFPRRRRGRRHGGRAAEADRNLGRRRQRRGRSSARGCAGWATSTGRRSWSGVVALAVILALRFTVPAVPGALVLVVGGLLASALFDLGAHGVAVVGDVPRGLPAPMLPDYDIVRQNLAVIGIAAVALLLIGFSQTAGDARAFATRHRYRIDVDQESVAQGMANVGAGVFQGMPVSTSLSASSLNESAGARTPVASLVTGGARPRDPDRARAAVLGAAEGSAGGDHHRRGRVRDDRHPGAAAPVPGHPVRLLDRHRRLPRRALGGRPRRRRGRRGPLDRLVDLRRHAASDAASGREPDTQVFRDIQENPLDETREGIVVLRLDGGLFFATAEALENRIRGLVDDKVRALVLDLEGVNFVDSQGSAKLTEIYEFLDAEGVELRLARLKPQVLAVLQADGVADKSAPTTSTATSIAPSRRSAANTPAGSRSDVGRVGRACGRRAGPGGGRSESELEALHDARK